MRRLLVFLLVTISAFAGLASASPPTLTRSAECPWKLGVVRSPNSEEVSFEEATHYLRPAEWEERNKVFGPGSLVAYVRIDSRNHGYLEIEDWKAGSDSVFVFRSAGLPAWSPDGKYLSCNVWTERTRGGKLCVLDASTWKTVVDVDLAHASDTKWSPDAKMIACAGVSYMSTGCVVYTVTVPDGTRHLLNPGSVGQPRDGDPRAAFAIVDTDARDATLYRIDYPVEEAQARILEEGLPEVLAQRLALGR